MTSARLWQHTLDQDWPGLFSPLHCKLCCDCHEIPIISCSCPNLCKLANAANAIEHMSVAYSLCMSGPKWMSISKQIATCHQKVYVKLFNGFCMLQKSATSMSQYCLHCHPFSRVLPSVLRQMLPMGCPICAPHPFLRCPYGCSPAITPCQLGQ